MRFTSLHIIRGWFTGIRSWRGRGGIRILGFGLAVRIFRSDLALESAGGEDTDGDGAIGDSIGITITLCLTTAGITPEAGRFTTGAVLPEAEACGAGVLTAEGELGLSTETGKQLEATPHPTARAAHDREHSAATAMAGRPGATLHAVAPVWVAEDSMVEAVDRMAVVADGGD
jgi:hypothetical protein